MAILFLGAGFSKTFEIPTMEEMTRDLPRLDLDVRERQLLKSIRERLSNYRHYDIEAVLTVLDYLSDPERVVNEVVNAAPTQFFIEPKESWSNASLEARNRCYGIGDPDKVKKAVIKHIKSVCQMKPEKEDLFPLIDQLLILLGLHLDGVDLRNTLGKKPVGKQLNHRIFTTNYDNVLCAYSNQREALCMNGEISQNQVRIHEKTNPLLYDEKEKAFKIFRLHGFITWFIDKHKQDMRHSGEVLQPGARSLLGDEPDREAMIFPIGGKYVYKEPYCDMFFHLKEVLQEAKLVTVIGYSFRDTDVVGLFVDASILNPELTMVLLDPKAEEIKKERLTDFQGMILPAVQKFDGDGLRSLEREIARWLILKENQPPSGSVEVRDVLNEDSEFERAFSEACDRAGDRSEDLRARRQEGTLELFKVISGCKFKVDGYDWNDRKRVDVGGNVWVTNGRKNKE